MAYDQITSVVAVNTRWSNYRRRRRSVHAKMAYARQFRTQRATTASTSATIISGQYATRRNTSVHDGTWVASRTSTSISTSVSTSTSISSMASTST
eukprot:306575_1